MNSVTLIGRLTKDADVRTTQGAEPMTIARFTLAVNRQKKGEADYINCVAFGKTAEVIGKYCSKGSQIGVTGHIQTGSYTKQDGTKVYTTDVIVDKMDFCGSNEKTEAPPHQQTMAEQEGFYNVPESLNDGESLPFN